MSDVADILAAARETLTPPGAWNPRGGVMARTRRGAACTATDAAAVQWGLMSAVYKAYCEMRTPHGLGFDAVLAALHAEALGPDLSAAIARANDLNRLLDAWRAGRASPAPTLDTQPSHGTLRWLVARYMLSPAWAKVSERSRRDYVEGRGKG